MIRLVFTKEREVILFEIDNKNITYRDRQWQQGIRFIPKDENFMRQVIMSRNKLAYDMIRWIEDANKGDNLKEWQACKSDDEVAEVIIKEAKEKGCVLRNKVIGNENENK